MQCCFTFILFSEKIGDFSVPLLSFHGNFASMVLFASKSLVSIIFEIFVEIVHTITLKLSLRFYVFIILECLMAQTLKSISQDN